MAPLFLDMKPIGRLTDDQFFDLCQANRDLRIERTAQGQLVIMAPTGGESGYRNSEATYQTHAWSRADGSGLTFDSSTGFTLPNQATYAPDVSWVRRDRWNALTPEQKQKFPPLAPDFVIELRSQSDVLKDLRAKMQEYIDNGVRLGFLLDPQTRQVEIYRPGLPMEILDNPVQVSGESVLPGFVLELKPIWQVE